MHYEKLSIDQQRDIHEQLLAQYEAKHIELSGLLAGATAMGADDDADRLRTQVLNLEALVTEHRAKRDGLKPTPQNREQRRATRKKGTEPA